MVDVALTQDGRTVFTAGNWDGLACAWDITTGRLLQKFEHIARVKAVTLGPDDRTLFAGCSDGSARAWDITTSRLQRIFEGHANSVEIIAVSHNGRILFTGHEDGSTQAWDSVTGRLLNTFRGHTRAVNALVHQCINSHKMNNQFLLISIKLRY